MSKLHCFHWRQHVALDVGTATTRIAAGSSSLIERPSKIGTRPALANGVVLDGGTVLEILTPLLDRARLFGIVKPCILACAPSDARQDERELLADLIMDAGAAALSMIPEPLAAAIGSGIDVSSPYAHMVLDIGEGVTDCAVIKAGKIYATCAIRKGCAHLRSAIVQTARCAGITCTADDAEILIRTCGIRGSSVKTGSALALMAMNPIIEHIATTMESFVRDLPDSLACDIIDSGICLTGGGALIPGVSEYLEQYLSINIQVAGNPLTSVAEGARAVLPVVVALNQWQ